MVFVCRDRKPKWTFTEIQDEPLMRGYWDPRLSLLILSVTAREMSSSFSPSAGCYVITE